MESVEECPGSPTALWFRRVCRLNHRIMAMVLFPACGTLWGPGGSQSPGVKSPCTAEQGGGGG